MKLKKVLVVVGVLIAIATMLTGCGKHGSRIKEFKKEVQDVVNSVKDEVNEVKNDIDEAKNGINEAKNEIINVKNEITSGFSTDYNYEISFENEEYVTRNSENKVVFKNTRNVPTVTCTNNPEAAKKIEESLRKKSDKQWESLKRSADEYTAEGMKAYDEPYGVSYMMSTLAKNNKYVTIQIDQSGSMGGVSWTGLELYTYDSKNGELLTIDNIAKDSNTLKQFLRTKIKEYVTNNFQNVSQNDLDSKINDILDDDENYGLSDDKFIIVLPKYSIGVGADGVKTVEIDKSEINNYLADQYKM